jgi:hypothetical protein
MEVQASGKSTFYADHWSRVHLRTNLDMRRTRNREKPTVEDKLGKLD